MTVVGHHLIIAAVWLVQPHRLTFVKEHAIDNAIKENPTPASVGLIFRLRAITADALRGWYWRLSYRRSETPGRSASG